MSQRIIITGTTGMVGEGVLLTCLAQPEVAAMLPISRRPSGHAHPKLRELLVPDLADLSAVGNQLVSYTTCFFCAGVSAVGMSEADYTRATHDLTLHFAQMLAQYLPKIMFVYVSGAVTDSREQSRQMWVRVKGRTENHLLQLPFRSSYMFRPGLMQPLARQRHAKPLLALMGHLTPVLAAGPSLCMLAARGGPGHAACCRARRS